MLKEIRKYYGIPQSTFADYLSVSRSRFSMVEIRRRNLPAPIDLALTPLYLAISQPITTQDEKLSAALTTEEEDLSKFIAKRILDNEYKLILLQKNLTKMQEDQARSIHILEIMDSLKDDKKLKKLSLLDLIGNTARKTQSKTGKIPQMKLELQIHSLQAELSYLKK